MSTAKQILLIAILIALLAACSRSEQGEGAAEASADEVLPRETTPPEDAPAVPMRLTEEGRERAAESVVVPADPRDTAFEAPRFTAVPFFPRDFELDRLGRTGVMSARDRSAFAAGEALFVALGRGELPVDLLGPSIGPGGVAILEDLMWQADDLGEARYGIVETLNDGEVAVPFRLLGSSRVALGELVLEKVDDQWYTADIQVEYTDRNTTSRFDPGAATSVGQ